MECTIRREGNEDYLEHFGIKGQKWGVRRFENEDGSLTEAGKERYSLRDRSTDRRAYKRASKKLEKLAEKADIKTQRRIAERQSEKARKNLAKGAIAGGAAALAVTGMRNKWANTSEVDKFMTRSDDAASMLNGFGNMAVAGLAGLGVFHVGKAAYHGIRASAAKKRASGLGHDEAVAKYKKQVDSMLERFSGTPYEEYTREKINKYNIR